MHVAWYGIIASSFFLKRNASLVSESLEHKNHIPGDNGNDLAKPLKMDISVGFTVLIVLTISLLWYNLLQFMLIGHVVVTIL